MITLTEEVINFANHAQLTKEPEFVRPLASQIEALLHLAMVEVDPDLLGVDAMLDKFLAVERTQGRKLR